MRTVAIAMLIVGQLDLTALAQVPIWTRQGTVSPLLTTFNGQTAMIGDVDGDGYEDVLQDSIAHITLQGLRIYSGRDGATLRMQPPFLSPFNFGVSTIVGTGDMNGDGIGDYALGWRSSLSTTNIVQVRSAADDSLLWQRTGSWQDQYAYHLAGNLDTDGDGQRDLVVSAERENGFRGAIRVYGNNGTLRYTIANLPGVFYLGRSLATIGDINGDGCDDFAAGAVEAVGVVIAFSGLTGAELRRGYGDNDGVLGWSVTGCGDMNGDGVPDFAGGTAGGGGERGMVRVFSGASGNALYTWWSPSTQQYGNSFGAEIRGGCDVNRDGVPDLLVASADYNSTIGVAYLGAYSGRDGSRLFLTSLTAPGSLLGLTTFPGVPFPGYLTYLSTIVPAPFGATDVGRLRMNVASPPGVEFLGSTCAGTLPTTPKIGIHQTQQGTTRIHLSGAAPSGFGILMLGLSSTNYAGQLLPYPLSGFGFSGCMLSTSIDAYAVVGLGSTGNAAGYGFFDLPLPLAATGLTIHGQWLALHTGTAAPGGVSDALRWRH